MKAPKKKVLIETVVSYFLCHSLFSHFHFTHSQKIEQSYEKTPTLHVVFGLNEIKDVDQSGFMVYFLKKTIVPIRMYSVSIRCDNM